MTMFCRPVVLTKNENGEGGLVEIIIVSHLAWGREIVMPTYTWVGCIGSSRVELQREINLTKVSFLGAENRV